MVHGVPKSRTWLSAAQPNTLWDRKAWTIVSRRFRSPWYTMEWGLEDRLFLLLLLLLLRHFTRVWLCATRLWDSPGKNTGVGCHFLLRSLLNHRLRLCTSLLNLEAERVCQQRPAERSSSKDGPSHSYPACQGSALGPDSGCGSGSSGFSCLFAHKEAMETMVTKSADLHNSYTFHNIIRNYNSDLSTSWTYRNSTRFHWENDFPKLH